jgi:UDP-N-acetylglucosamine--N-acetylmuramyl-(pentapeptide) pyrophosphoryl-undecaprenol N-acetylglucosamine transferase
LNPEQLAKLLQTTTRDDCLAMAEAAQAVGRRDANAAIARVLEELANGGQ